MRFYRALTVGLLVLGASASTGDKKNDVGTNDDTELICHTSDPADCYPRVFVPTDYFQVVHDDQAIPKGLHVRLDVQTGQKEAKLNDPTADTDSQNIIKILPDDAPGVETGNAIEVLPDEPLRDELLGADDGEIQRQAQQVLNEMRKAKASKGETLKPPMGASGDRELFSQNLKIIEDYLVNEDAALAPAVEGALEELEDLCHDIYWGNELVKAAGIPAEHPRLLTLLRTRPGNIRSLFVRLLATSLRNNAAALDEFERIQYSSKPDPYSCKNRDSYPSSYTGTVVNAFLHLIWNDTQSLSRTISFISAVLPREVFSEAFVRHGGLVTLRDAMIRHAEHFSADGVDSSEFERVAHKVEDLFSDHYLNTDGRVMIEALGKKFESERIDESTDDGRQRPVSLDAWCEELEAGSEILQASWFKKDHRTSGRSWFESDICNAWGDTPSKQVYTQDKSEL